MDLLENSIIEYKKWLDQTKDDAYMQRELAQLENSPEELLECFGGDLSFGTSGIRGIIGPGPRRINRYVVARATQGLSDYIKTREAEGCDIKKRVVIACDSRRFSTQFAKETAEVLSGNGIKAFLFAEITPVPVLSYAIGALDCDYGIMITASHNASIFNGYKVFSSMGHQIVGEEPNGILEAISKHDFFDGINRSGDNIELIEDGISAKFLEEVNSVTKPFVRKNDEPDIKIVYTPLNGAGRNYVYKALNDANFSNVISVPSQDGYDENFTTCKKPNPEKLSAYNEAFKILDREDADIIIATDPDSDRVGVALIHDGTKINLTGNQIGLLMLDHLCSTIPPKDGQIVFRSMVSSPLIDRMADANGLQISITRSGFKHIGFEIAELIKNGNEDLYYFGFEDSNGFLISPFIRDKDSITSAVVIASIASKQKKRGQDLVDHLEEIYGDYGTLIDRTKSFTFEGLSGQETMKEIMDYLRNGIDDHIGDLYIEDKIDYLNDDTGLEPANVIKFELDDGSTVIVRPSGTEPKLKAYMFLTDPTSSIDKSITEIMDNYR